MTGSRAAMFRVVVSTSGREVTANWTTPRFIVRPYGAVAVRSARRAVTSLARKVSRTESPEARGSTCTWESWPVEKSGE